MASRERKLVARRERRMDVQTKKVEQVSVLLDTAQLTKAAKEATKGGKKRINGIYQPSGQKIELAANDALDKADAIQNEAAKHDANLANVGRAYHERRHAHNKAAHRAHQTEEEYDDAIADIAAKKVLKASNEHEKMEYQELFNFFDVDKDKTWGSIEFAQRMSDIGFPTTVEDASNYLYFAGVRDVDRITYNDFVQMMPKLKAYRIILEKDAMARFAEHDVDGDGTLGKGAIRKVVLALAGPDGISKQQVERIVKKADRERTGMITFDFFIRALIGMPPILTYKKPQPEGLIERLALRLAKLCGRGPKENYADHSVAELEEDSDSEEEREREKMRQLEKKAKKEAKRKAREEEGADKSKKGKDKGKDKGNKV
eukprot:gnl/TRDRNA2_/TRDRNA2_163974_c0_seq1.p1 gnl/TRDRNA2_/TRDRNA2_163974_c0~~gnl/TRDRNA2_/TRDRNA2_163974_c0_seq1.p1  ORF type:complete len:373 (-),score=104.94 gnl/TRDRNA2_/TRDRNA2_163974_c0_seq1:140-1258(-)